MCHVTPKNNQMYRKVSANLPELVLRKAEEAGVNVRHVPGALPIFELIDNCLAIYLVRNYWKRNPYMDPVLSATFGNVLYPYVTPAAQVEVLSILETFQRQLADDLQGNFPLTIVNAAPLGGFQYHHSQMALFAVQEELQQLQRFAGLCPNLAALQSGQIICDLNVTYANAILSIRIRRF